MAFTKFNIYNHGNEVDDFYTELNNLLVELKYPRRKAILKSLPPEKQRTFEELKIDTGIPTGSLHHHLSKLCDAGLVNKTPDWPRKYERSDFLNRLVNAIERFEDDLEKDRIRERNKKLEYHLGIKYEEILNKILLRP